MMGDCATTEHVLSHIIPQLLSNGISITLVCTMMALFDWRMALSIFGTVPVSLLVILGSKRLQNKLSEKFTDIKLEASDHVQEYLEGVKVIKACGLNGEKFSALDRAMHAMMRMAMKMELVTGVFVTGAQMLLQAGVGIVVFVGVNLLTGGKIELIPLLMFFLIVVRIYGPVVTEFTLLPELFHHRQATKRMRSLMNASVMEGDAQKTISSYEIAFDHVSFRYHEEEGEAVIDDLSVTISADAITALVGPSGCGKSTISRLIARFWDVNAGRWTIGGVDVKQMDPEALMRSMSFVFQDVVLFNDTVYNNIPSAIWTQRRSRCTPRQRPPAAMLLSSACRMVTRACLARTGLRSPAGSGSASRLRVRCSKTRRSFCSTRRQPRSIRKTRRRFSRRSHT